jgi:hypothetical protein
MYAYIKGEDYMLRQDMISGRIPTLANMFKFLTMIKNMSPLFSAECHIISLIYFNRLTNMASIRVTSNRWQKLWLSCFILAQKVWNDKPMRTSDFSNILPSVDKHVLRQLECQVLFLLDFSTNVSASLYTMYYFDLRQLHITGCNEAKEWSIKPLSICQALKLEVSIILNNNK